jgi:transposase
MGRAYSLDLRERISGYISRGGSRRGAARHFGVSPSTAVRIAAQMAERGTLEPRRLGRPPGRGKLAPYVDFLVEIVEAVPDIALAELAEALEAEHGVRVHPSSISRVLITAGVTYKKNARGVGARPARDQRRARPLGQAHPAAHARGAAPADLRR